MLTERPLARDDLDAAPREVDDETVYFIGDPIKNEYKQLDELQYEVFRRLDGTRTLEQLATELFEEFEIEVDAEELAEFVGGLGEMDLLDPSSFAGGFQRDPEAAQAILASLRRRGVVYGERATDGVHIPLAGVDRRLHHEEALSFDRALVSLKLGDLHDAATHLRQVLNHNPANYRARYLLKELLTELVGERQNMESIWFWRIPLTNPDRFLERLDRLVGRLIYSRAAAVLYVLGLALCMGMLLFDLDRVLADFRYVLSFRWLLNTPQAVPILWVLGALGLYGHECAHGLTCKHYGGRVREMGLLFAYLSPSAYCDVSSSYLIEGRRHRVAIALAGVTLNLGVWMLFVGAWMLFRTDTVLGIVSFVMVMNAPGYFMNLNPMVRSDGYLAVSDLVEYPNLRTDAFEYLRLLSTRIFLGEDVDIPEELEAKRRLFLWYAIPGSIGTVIVVGGALYVLVTTLISELHTIGIAISALLLWSAVGRNLVKIPMLAWRERRRLAASRRFRRLAIPVALALVGLLFLPLPLTVTARCETSPAVEQVRSPLAGAVAEIAVADGALVRQGQLLLKLDVSALQTAVARSEAELEGAELDLQKLQNRARDEELGVARARLEAEQSLLNSSARGLARLRRLARSSLVAGDDIDRLVGQREKARTRVAQASGEVRSLSASALKAELDVAEAVISILRAQLAEDQRRVEAATVVSPVDGIVHFMGPREAMLGQVVDEGEILASVRASGGERLRLQIPITAPIDVVSLGARVDARLSGAPHRVLSGGLEEIGAAFEITDTERSTTRSVIVAYVKLDDAEAVRDLPRGLSGNAEIGAGWYPLAWHLALRAVRLVEVDLNYVLTSL